MAFYGYEFIFDGVPCSKYGLMLCDIGSNKQNDAVNFTSVGKLVSDKISRQPASILYGEEDNEPLSFDMVFAASPERMESGIPFDRYEIEAIASWLSRHDTWKWLQIDQPDLEGVRFKCLITELKQISYSSLPWAFSCTVTCDSPYAYREQHPIEYTCSSASTNILFRNRSSYNGIYYPTIEIGVNGASAVEIVNHSNQGRSFKFANIPASVKTIVVDNDKKIISTDAGLNIYDCFNFNFLGLVRGDNALTINGECTLKFICDFPVNIGA